MEISGIVHKKLPVQTGVGRTGNEWKKVDFVIETQDQYPKKICFTAWGDRVPDVENLQDGQRIKVSFDLASREYNDRWYTDIKAWKIELEEEGAPAPAPQYAQPAAPANNPAPAASNGGASEQEDDLPF